VRPCVIAAAHLVCFPIYIHKGPYQHASFVHNSLAKSGGSSALADEAATVTVHSTPTDPNLHHGSSNQWSRFVLVVGLLLIFACQSVCLNVEAFVGGRELRPRDSIQKLFVAHGWIALVVVSGSRRGRPRLLKNGKPV